MMKKLTSKKLVSMLVVALFMLFFAGVAVPQESQAAEVKKMEGTISDIKPDIGKVTVVEKESGKTITLIAGSDVDLKDFNVGDHVVAEYTCDLVIKSINKQTV
ncbi:MAG: hypothetical protein SV775_06510 [Thermodesulfobacteriota bacterium]|nr:hypothetical protein [Thermodesulfobacteriota bacterium]